MRKTVVSFFQKKGWFFWLAAAAQLGCFLVVFPLLQLTLVLLSPHGSGAGLLFLGILAILSGFLGVLLREMLHRLPSVASNVCALLALPIFCAIVGGLLSLHSSLAGWVFGLLCTVNFCWGQRLWGKPYGEILTYRVFLTGAGISLASTVGLWWMDRTLGQTASAGPICAVFLLLTLLYGMIRNQSNLDYLMERRRHSLKFLPEKIRRYNLQLIGLCALFCAISFLAREWVYRLLEWGGLLLGKLLVLLLRFLAFLGSLLLHEQGDSATANMGPLSLPAAEDGAGGTDYWLILLLASCIFMVFRFRRQLLRRLREWGRCLLDWTARFLHGARPARVRREVSEHYQDRIEKLDPRIGGGRTAHETFRPRHWRRSWRQWQKTEKSIEKYRSGYQLLLQWLRIHEPSLRDSDTVLETLELTRSLLPESYASCVRGYCEARYREENPSSEEWEALELTLQKINQTL